jgi:anti-anti-sigma factor
MSIETGSRSTMRSASAWSRPRWSAVGHAFTSVACDHGVTTIALDGELDPATVPVLISTVADRLQDGQERVVIDLGGVTFIDCAGLRALELLAGLPSVHLIRFSTAVRRLVGIVGAHTLEGAS